MSGGGKKGRTTDVVNGLQLGTSSYGRPVAIVFGRNRVGSNVIWMPHNEWHQYPGDGAGKGGGSGQKEDRYTQSVMMAICEGPIPALLRVWRDKEPFDQITGVDPDFQTFLGARPQSPWSYLSIPRGARYVVYATVPAAAPYTFTVTAEDFSDVAAVYAVIHTGEYRGSHLLTQGTDWTHAGNVITFADHFHPVGSPFYDPAPTITLAGQDVSIVYTTLIDHSAASIGYGGTALVAVQDLDLGNSNTLKNFTHEVRGILSAAAPDSGDVNAASVIAEFLSNTSFGHGWATSMFDVVNGQDPANLTTSGFQAACTAYDYRISPVLNEQKAASKWIDEWLVASNASCTWGDGKLKFIPLSEWGKDSYTSYVTPIYDLDRDDFVVKGPTDDAITVTRTAQEDTYNQITVEFLAREASEADTDEERKTRDDYNISEQDSVEQADVNGSWLRKPDSPTQLHCITRRAHARSIADVLTRRSVHHRSTYKFTLPPRFALLEPLDLLRISDDLAGVSNQLVRILSIEENEDLDLVFEAVEWKSGISQPAVMASQAGEGQGQNAVANPFSTLPPVILAVRDPFELWVGVAGGSKDFGGAAVWLSWDSGTSYSLVGEALPTAWGLLSADLASGPQVDTTHTLGVDLRASAGTLTTLSQADYDAAAFPLVVDREVIQYKTATLTGANQYNLTTLRRGLRGTNPSAHTIASTRVCAANGMLKIPLDQSRIGSTVYVKLQAFNLSRQRYEDLSTCPVVTYPIQNAVLLGSELIDSFDTFNAEEWQFVESAGPLTVVTGVGVAGGAVLRAAGHTRVIHKRLIPYDPAKLYRFSARVRQYAEPTNGQKTFSMGFAGVAGDYTAWVNTTGANSYDSQHYQSNATLGSGWTQVYGYWSGTANPGTAGGTMTVPGKAHDNVRYMRPVLIFNSSGGDGTQDIDAYEVQEVDASGADPKFLSLITTSNLFRVNVSGVGSPTSITLTAFLGGGLTGTAAFSVTAGTATLGGSSPSLSRTLAFADMGTDSVTIHVEVTDAGTTYYDNITIVKLYDGATGGTGAAGTNAQLMTLALSSPVFTYDGSGTRSPTSQTITISAVLQNITGTVDMTATAYTAGGTSLGSVTLTRVDSTSFTMTAAAFDNWGSTVAYATVSASLSPLSASTRIYKLQAGAPGTNGTGANAYVLALNSSAEAFTFGPTGAAVPSAQTIYFTANCQNIGPGATFQCQKYNADGSTLGAAFNLTGSGDTDRPLTLSEFGAAHHAKVTASVSGYSDFITVVRLQDGSGAITPSMPNASHTVPAANDGTVPTSNPNGYLGSGTTIRVFEGATALTFASTIAAGSFTVGTATLSPASSITVGGYSGQTTTTCTVADHSGMSASPTVQVVTITYPLTIRRINAADGTNDITLNLVQTITKSMAGAQGNQGTQGDPGVSSLGAIMTKEALVLRGDAGGNLQGTSPYGSSQIRIFQGVTEQTGWSVAVAPASDAATVTYTTSTVTNTNDSVSITGMNVNVFAHTLTLTATKSGQNTLVRYLQITKTRDGAAGTNGTNAATLALTATAQAFTFNSSGTATPSGQSISLHANLQNLTGGTLSWVAHRYDAAGGALSDPTLGGTGVDRTLAVADFGAAAYATVTASYTGGYSDAVTIVRLQDAAPGVNAVSGYLTNESHVVPASSTGTVASGDWAACGGTFKVYNGTTDVTASAGITRTGYTGFTTGQISISGTTGVYTITGLDVDIGTATFQGTFNGVTITKTYVLAKSKQGLVGSTGQRGSNEFYVDMAPLGHSVWDDEHAWTTANAFGSGAVINDRVTEYNQSTPFSTTKFLSSLTPSPYGTWTTVTQVIDGNLLVTGTVGARQVATNSLNTNHLAVQGVDYSLNTDPGMQSVRTSAAGSGAWGLYDYSLLTTYPQRIAINDYAGRAFMVQNVAGEACAVQSELVPVDTSTGAVYKLSLAYKRGATSCALYAGVRWYTYDKILILDPAPAGWTNNVTYDASLLLSNVTGSTSWASSTVAFGGGQSFAIPSNARWCRIFLLLNGGATAGAQFMVTDAKIQRWLGGDLIVDGTISTQKLNFTPVASTNVIATINASTEGLDIAADRISIDGTTTFSAGYNPTGKIASGGAAADVNANATTINGPKITTGSITAQHMEIKGTELTLNSDPGMQSVKTNNTTAGLGTWAHYELDANAYLVRNAVTDLDGRAYSVANPTGTFAVAQSEKIPISWARRYRLSFSYRRGATACYLDAGIRWFDANGNIILDPTPGGWTNNTAYDASYLVASGAGSTAWTTASCSFGSGAAYGIPANARWCRIFFLLNSTSAAGAVMEATDAKIMESLDGNLIVDGTVTAPKLSITTGASRNEMRNSGFEEQPPLGGWANYSGSWETPPETGTLTLGTDGGRTGPNYAISTNTNVHAIVACGIFKSGWSGPNWRTNRWYAVSWYAKAPATSPGNASIGSRPRLAWNLGPTYTTVAANPPLTANWQRYVFYIYFTAAAYPEIFFTYALDANGNELAAGVGAKANGAAIHYDDFQVEEGDLATAYAPGPPSEILVKGSGTNGTQEQGVWVDGEIISTGVQRGYNLVKFDRDLHTLVEQAHYDTYGADDAAGQIARANMASWLNYQPAGTMVAIYSYDAIGTYTASNDLVIALKSFGATSACEVPTRGRYPYALIGFKGVGEGKGFESRLDLTVGLPAAAVMGSWRGGVVSAARDGLSDFTVIEGGRIRTNTVTAQQLNFEAVSPTGEGNTVAVISAINDGRNNGLYIGANRITISGTTVFEGGGTLASHTVAAGAAAQDINNNATTINGGKITTGSITTSQLAVTGTEFALNADPGCASVRTAAGADAVWSGYEFSPLALVRWDITDYPGRSSAVSNPTGTLAYAMSELVPISYLKTYRLSFGVKRSAALGYFSAGIRWYTAKDPASLILDPTPAGWVANYAYDASLFVSNAAAGTTWGSNSVSFGYNQPYAIPSNATHCRIFFALNSTTALSHWTQVTDVRLAERMDGRLIVDGTVTADTFSGNILKTANYAFTGGEGTPTEVATAGAKMQSALGGTAFLTAANNCKVGRYTLEEQFALNAAANYPAMVTWPSGGTAYAMAAINGIITVVGGGMSNTSTDMGRSWTARTIPAGTYRAIAPDSTYGIAVGDNVAAYQLPGGNWSASGIGAGLWTGVCGTIVSGVWVAVRSDANQSLRLTTYNGAWGNAAVPFTGSGRGHGIFWDNNGYFFAYGRDVVSSVAVASTSMDGITWTPVTLPSHSGITAPTSAGCVAGGAYGTDVTLVYPGRTFKRASGTWTSAVNNLSAYPYSMVHNGRVYVVATRGALVYISTDAITWVAVDPRIATVSCVQWYGSALTSALTSWISLGGSAFANSLSLITL